MGALTLAPRMQLAGNKSAPPVPAGGVPAGRGAGGGGAYVHTYRNISRKNYDGGDICDRDRERNRKRFKVLLKVFQALQNTEESQAVKGLLGCGSWFRRITFPCGTSKLVPYPCDSMFCPHCANRRSKVYQERVLRKIDQKKFDYFFLTLTVKSWEALTREGIDRVVRMFGEFRGSDDWRDAGVVGGVYSIEATYTRAGWHPHLHVLIEVRKGALSLDFLARFKKRWLAVTGDSHVLHLEKMYGTDEKGGKIRTIDARSLRELVKYSTKAASFAEASTRAHEPNRVLEFYLAFKNVRRVQAFGSFLGSMGESEDERIEDSKEFVGCACGLCTWNKGFDSGLFHISQTKLDLNGERQLKLFAFDSSPAKPPPKIEETVFPNKNLDLFFHQHELRLN